MDNVHVLKELGLNEHQARVYLALLQGGPSSVLQVSRITQLKRPTIYLILDELTNKGLVALVPGEKKRLFLSLSPERLQEELEKKTRLLQKSLPELLALHRTQTAKPTIQFFDTREGMMTIYKEIAATRAKELLTFFSLQDVPQEFLESYELFIHGFKKGAMRVREIAYAKDKNHFYLNALKSLPNYEVRFTPKEYKFLTDNFIYANKVAIFSFKKRFAVTIESEDVANSFRSLFELAWRSAER
jgi:sugar-specific transcriptional regulator TrmB